MASMRDLRRAINEEGAVREALFDYHYGNGLYATMPEEDARIIFEQQLQDTAEMQILLGAYLPIYERTQNQQQVQRRQGTLEGMIKKSIGVGVLGLAFLVGASLVVDNSKARKFYQAVGGGATAIGAVAVAAHYTRRRNTP